MLIIISIIILFLSLLILSEPTTSSDIIHNDDNNIPSILGTPLFAPIATTILNQITLEPNYLSTPVQLDVSFQNNYSITNGGDIEFDHNKRIELIVPKWWDARQNITHLHCTLTGLPHITILLTPTFISASDHNIEKPSLYEFILDEHDNTTIIPKEQILTLSCTNFDTPTIMPDELIQDTYLSTQPITPIDTHTHNINTQPFQIHLIDNTKPQQPLITHNLYLSTGLIHKPNIYDIINFEPPRLNTTTRMIISFLIENDSKFKLQKGVHDIFVIFPDWFFHHDNHHFTSNYNSNNHNNGSATTNITTPLPLPQCTWKYTGTNTLFSLTPKWSLPALQLTIHTQDVNLEYGDLCEIICDNIITPFQLPKQSRINPLLQPKLHSTYLLQQQHDNIDTIHRDHHKGDSNSDDHDDDDNDSNYDPYNDTFAIVITTQAHDTTLFEKSLVLQSHFIPQL